MLKQLFKFKGGVKPPSNKDQSQALPIGIAPIPPTLIVPLHQSIGGEAKPLVQVGEHVRKGQRIGASDKWISSSVHAPTSGTIIAIEKTVATHPSGLPTLSVIIEADGNDTWIERSPLNYTQMAPEAVREYLRESGVVGLGGAVFPSHAKLTPASGTPMEELVINGAECEPFMTCDDLLMRERADDVVRGIGVFRDLLRPKRILIGIEDNKPAAIYAMKAAVSAAQEPFEVIVVPTLYPAGGAKQLIRVLTGKEIPASRRSPEMGVQCFNVATAYTAWRAIAYGEPVISRIVTLAGNVETARNWEVRIGTPIEALLPLMAPKADTNRYIMGGPMMGFDLPTLTSPVVKATNCIIASSPTLFAPPAPEMPCIRCGHCATACPHELQPFELYWFSHAKNFGKAQEYNLFDCIECGCCSYVCPSHIPLVQYFRFAKSEIWSREQENEKAHAAKERFEFRNARAEREKAEKAERLARAAAATKAAQVAKVATDSPPPSHSEDLQKPLDPAAAKKAAIAAAMERARKQREAAQPKNTETLTPAQQQEIAEINVRRAALQLKESPSVGEPASSPSSDSPPALDAAAVKKAVIAAAMERARKQREAAQPKNTDALTAAQRQEITEIDARRALLSTEETPNLNNGSEQP